MRNFILILLGCMLSLSASSQETMSIDLFDWTVSGIYKSFDTKTIHYRESNPPDSMFITLDGFSMPMATYPVITSRFGIRWGRMHYGTDMAMPIGTEVRSAFAGCVRMTGFEKGGYGCFVIIRHTNGLETYYAHLSQILVQPGELVTAGQRIALSGSTGRSTGPHLHFETRLCGQPINPENIIDFMHCTATETGFVFIWAHNPVTYQSHKRTLRQKPYKRKNRQQNRRRRH